MILFFFCFQYSAYVSVINILVLVLWKFKTDINQFRFVMARLAEDEQTSLLIERTGCPVSYNSVAYVSNVLCPVGLSVTARTVP